jgi:Na+-translocating ferredoxin:NAD+ oxidoreductase RnfC subunit
MTSVSIDMNTPPTWELETSVTDMPSFAVLGTYGARLLAGPARAEGSELLSAHERRLGQLDLDSTNSDELRLVITESGLLGRGGGQFPIARKIELAATSGVSPIVVVNASEGEPASRKDRTLLEMRPHLILDGAMVAAKAVNTHEIVIYHHHTPHDSTSPIERAIAERPPSE